MSDIETEQLTSTPFEEGRHLNATNFEKETGFPLEFAFTLLMDGSKEKENDPQASYLMIFNLVCRLMGYNGRVDRDHLISGIKEAYDKFQEWKKDHAAQQS